DVARTWHQLLGVIDATNWPARDPIVLHADTTPTIDSIGGSDRALGIRAWISVPLRQRGTLNGLLVLASRAANKFDQSETTLIGTVGAEISVAITNSRLYEETRQRVEELSLLNEVSRMLTSTLDLDKVLRVIMEATVSMLQGEAGSVLLLDEATGDLVFAAAVGPDAESIVGLRLPAGQGIAQRALTEDHALLIDDVQQDDNFYPGIDRVTSLTTRRIIAAPLRTHGRLIGVMEIINKRRAEFSDADLRILDLLTPTAAAAIENARLYARDTQLSAEVRRRNRELSALHALSAALSQSLEITSVLDISLVMIQPLFDYAEGSIALLDHDALNYLATHSATPHSLPAPDRAELADRFSREAIDAHAVKIIARIDQLDDRLAASWRQAGIGAMAAVPLWGHDHVQGVLQMIWHAARDFTDETAPLLAAMGQQIGVAIERAHLYEVAQRRAKEIEQSYALLVQSEKLAATGRLALSLAHEINNPLQAIQNCLHLALEFDLNETKRTEYLKLAREEVERLSILVQRMLDFYRPAPEAQTNADVRVVLERVLALSEQKLHHNDVELKLEIPTRQLLVQAAPDQMAQVFLNLIVNAAEAMEAGGQLKISSTANGDWIETRFEDNGPGIPSEQLPHIFEPFFTTKSDGTGLGLAISYTIVEHAGGSISVDSRSGEGTTFVVRLPKAAEKSD
ncbi:MAG TPA: GAF domain-containing protein, partial [Anaerolineae bacterium]|nr:GAF domain-containing protein [Anaerolineae bacterium]